MGWLITVARSRLIDHVRAEQRRDRKLSLAFSAAATEERADVHADPSLALFELGPATERALDALSTAERCALVLHHR